eukprot:TRINITY_DN5548_c0_g1_i1.p1 TRINITY_DN5548_c0_g1~~TRINITY_DN5548_c0_g1_i1.p1  ORF type:complete len:898 (+),score=173.15 TRINITY_DN5548_c0_g1_i1:127-2694(+)
MKTRAEYENFYLPPQPETNTMNSYKKSQQLDKPLNNLLDAVYSSSVTNSNQKGVEKALYFYASAKDPDDWCPFNLFRQALFIVKDNLELLKVLEKKVRSANSLICFYITLNAAERGDIEMMEEYLDKYEPKDDMYHKLALYSYAYNVDVSKAEEAFECTSIDRRNFRCLDIMLNLYGKIRDTSKLRSLFNKYYDMKLINSHSLSLYLSYVRDDYYQIISYLDYLVTYDYDIRMNNFAQFISDCGSIDIGLKILEWGKKNLSLNSDPYLLVANLAIDDGRVDIVKDIFQSIKDDNIALIDSNITRDILYKLSKHGLIDIILDLFAILIEKHKSDSSPFYTMIAKALTNHEHYDVAEKIFSILKRRHIMSELSFLALLRMNCQLGDMDSLQKNIEEMTMYGYPITPKIASLCMRTFFFLGQYEEALAFLEDNLSAFSNTSEDKHALYVEALRILFHFKDARKAHELFVSIPEYNSNLFKQYIEFCYDNNLYEEAESQFKRQFQLDIIPDYDTLSLAVENSIEYLYKEIFQFLMKYPKQKTLTLLKDVFQHVSRNQNREELIEELMLLVPNSLVSGVCDYLLEYSRYTMKNLQTLAQDNPSRGKIILEKLFQCTKIEEAVEFEELIGEDSQSSSLLYVTALNQSKEYKKARKFFETYTHEPLSTEMLNQKLISMSDEAGILYKFKDLIKSSTPNIQTYTIILSIAISLNDVDRCKYYYNVAIEKSQINQNMLSLILDYYIDTRQPEQEIQAIFEDIMQLNENVADHIMKRLILERPIREQSKAFRLVTFALNNNIYNPSTNFYTTLISLLASKKQMDMAKEYYDILKSTRTLPIEQEEHIRSIMNGEHKAKEKIQLIA